MKWISVVTLLYVCRFRSEEVLLSKTWLTRILCPQVVTNRDTLETLLCVAYVFEVSTSEHGAQHHIYRLVKDWHSRTVGPYLRQTHCSTSVSNNTKQWTILPPWAHRAETLQLGQEPRETPALCRRPATRPLLRETWDLRLRKLKWALWEKTNRRGPWCTVVSVPKEPNLQPTPPAWESCHRWCFSSHLISACFFLILDSFTHVHVQKVFATEESGCLRMPPSDLNMNNNGGKVIWN